MIDDLRERISILVENMEPDEAQKEYDKRVKIIERILDEQPTRTNDCKDRSVAA